MTDIGSNVFEEFYSTLKKTLITEAKNSSVKNLTPSERNYPVYARDKSDYKLKSEILSPDDNYAKTESIVSFLLSDALFEYFKNKIVSYFNEHEDYLDSEFTREKHPTYDEFNAKSDLFPLLKSYVSSEQQKYESKNKIVIPEDKFYTDVFMIDTDSWDAYFNQLNSAADFYDCYIEDLEIASITEDGTIVKHLNSGSIADRDILLKKLLHFTGSSGVLNTEKTAVWLKDNGFPNAKLRDCPAFTNVMNNNSEFESSTGYIKNSMINVFDPSEIDFSKINLNQKFYKAIDISDELLKHLQDVANTVEGSGYVSTKRNNLNSIIYVLDSNCSSISDFLIKLSDLISFVQNTDFAKDAEKNVDHYIKLKLNNAKETEDDRDFRLFNRSVSNVDNFNTLETVRNELREHLESLPPSFNKIMTYAQLMYSDTNKMSLKQSVKRLRNDATGKYVYFVIPNKNLEKTIDQERMGMSFFDLNNDKTDLDIANLLYSPIVMPDSQKKFELIGSKIEKILATVTKVDKNPNRTQGKAVKKYLLNSDTIDQFIDFIKSKGGDLTINKKDKKDGVINSIGDYINNNDKFNTTVVFSDADSWPVAITKDTIWKATRVTVNVYEFDGIEYKSLDIETPLMPLSADGFNIKQYGLDFSENGLLSITNRTNPKVLNSLKIDDTKYLKNPRKYGKQIAIEAAKQMLDTLFKQIYSKKVEKGTQKFESLFNSTKINTFIDSIITNFDINPELSDNSPSRVVTEVQKFFMIPKVNLVFLYMYIYYSVVTSGIDSLDSTGTKPAPASAAPTGTKASTSVVGELSSLQKQTESWFSASVGSGVSRTLNTVLSDTTRLYEASDLPREINKIFLRELKQNWLFSQIGGFMKYIRNSQKTTKPKSKSSAIGSVLNDNFKAQLNLAIEASLNPDLSTIVDFNLAPLSVYNEITDCNTIGQYFMLVFDKLKEDNKGFPYKLSFADSFKSFVDILNQIRSNGNLSSDDKEALSEVMKFYFYVTYSYYLILVVCQKKQDVFLVAKKTTSPVTKETTTNSTDDDDEADTYAYVAPDNPYLRTKARTENDIGHINW